MTIEATVWDCDKPETEGGGIIRAPVGRVVVRLAGGVAAYAGIKQEMTQGAAMRMRHLMHALVGLLVVVREQQRDERGLSQSAENAILLVGAATVAGIVITAMVAYVRSHMPK